MARGVHNTLSQYWVVSLLMALRAIEGDCFGSPCTSHNVSGGLHGPLTLAHTRNPNPNPNPNPHPDPSLCPSPNPIANPNQVGCTGL